MSVPNNWQVKVLKGLGVKPTSQAIADLNEWWRREGGGNKNDANYNPLNTTQRMPGSRSINSAGVQAYRTPQQGIQALLKTLRNGRYDDIVQALRTGQRLGSQASLSVWGTGQWSGTVGGSPGADQSGATPSTQPLAPSYTKQDALQEGLGALATGHYDPTAGLAALWKASVETARATQQRRSDTLSPLTPLRGGRGITFSGQHFTHQTDGLPGYPAVDIFAKAGTPFLAPEAGTIVRLSGRGGTSGNVFGWSIYFKGVSGRMYFITHLQKRRGQVGRHYRAGQPIGSVSPWKSGSSHAHVGVRG